MSGFCGDYDIDDVLTFYANTTRFDTGAATDADSAPSYRVYEDETGTAILNGSMALIDSSNTAGFYSEQITLSAANGFEVGKSYAIYIAGTVNSVAGATHRTFQVRGIKAVLNIIDDFLDTEVAAIKAKTDNLPSDPADASDIAGAFTTLNTKIDTIDDFLDTEIAAIKAKTDNLPADPADASDIASSFTTVNGKLDTIDDFLDTEVAAIKAKTDQLAFTDTNLLDVGVIRISRSAEAADNLEQSTEAIGYGTCDAAGTTTTVIASSITPASAVNEQFNGRVMIFKNDTTTAALRGQATTISDYVHATLTFTVVALTTAPASGDTFTIL